MTPAQIKALQDTKRYEDKGPDQYGGVGVSIYFSTIRTDVAARLRSMGLLRQVMFETAIPCPSCRGTGKVGQIGAKSATRPSHLAPHRK